MAYQQGYSMPSYMPRINNHSPQTPPHIWGPGGIQQQPNYGVIGQSYYHTQEQLSNYVAKRPTQYEYDFPPVSAPVYGQYRGSEYYYDSQPPILPPIRTHDLERPLQAIQEPEPKEEKVGGVASHLTYKMEHMIDYVSQMATALFHLYNRGCVFSDMNMPLTVQTTRVEVNPTFRKYVSQVLTSTRLPISTIMLALHYMTVRIEYLQKRSRRPSLQEDLAQMLTTSLMLASKFLDDNTFQNRSWAEVSNTPVKELNEHELAWLMDMGWHLQFDVEGDFRHWMECYECSGESKTMRSMQSSMEGLNISQDYLRQPSSTRYLPQPPPTPMYTPPSYHEQSFGQPVQRTNPWTWNRTSPASADRSYPTTPADWFKNPGSGFGQHSIINSSRPLPPLQILPSSQSPYYAPYPQHTPSWSSHPVGCRCCYNPMEYNRYSNGYHYGISTAA